jgi:nucleoside-diphosphate-sugar epimerase
MTKYLVTGASGFIGGHLVERLVRDGQHVRCLVRSSSDLTILRPLDLELVTGEITDPRAVQQAVEGVDVVINAAGMTSAHRYSTMLKVNRDGSGMVGWACAQQPQPPVHLLVSSIAASGPVQRGMIRQRRTPPTPVSKYGSSKRAGERAAEMFAGTVPTTIVRPGIVFGPRDREFFTVFQSVAEWRGHAVLGLCPPRISLIHVEDLVEILLRAARQGTRIVPGTAPSGCGQGFYFAVCPEYPDYARLGKTLKHLLREDGRGMPIFIPSPLSWFVFGLIQLISACRGTRSTLNLDKVREATAANWSCSTEELENELDFVPADCLKDRLMQTAQWYRQNGWLSG